MYRDFDSTGQNHNHIHLRARVSKCKSRLWASQVILVFIFFSAFQILVQHNYNADYSYKTAPLYVSPNNVVRNNVTHRNKGYLHNVAIITLDKKMDLAAFGTEIFAPSHR